MTVEVLLSQALTLPEDQRATLADRLQLSLTATVPVEPPKGQAIIGRGRGMLVEYIDDEHLKDFAEYLP